MLKRKFETTNWCAEFLSKLAKALSVPKSELVKWGKHGEILGLLYTWWWTRWSHMRFYFFFRCSNEKIVSHPPPAWWALWQACARWVLERPCPPGEQRVRSACADCRPWSWWTPYPTSHPRTLCEKGRHAGLSFSPLGWSGCVSRETSRAMSSCTKKTSTC